MRFCINVYMQTQQKHEVTLPEASFWMNGFKTLIMEPIRFSSSAPNKPFCVWNMQIAGLFWLRWHDGAIVSHQSDSLIYTFREGERGKPYPLAACMQPPPPTSFHLHCRTLAFQITSLPQNKRLSTPKGGITFTTKAKEFWTEVRIKEKE